MKRNSAILRRRSRSRWHRVRILRPAALVGGLSALLILAAACSSSGTTASQGSADTVAKGSSLVTSAKQVLKAASEGLIYSASNTPSGPGDLLPYGSWRGPTSAPAPRKNALIEIIPCTMQAASCATTAESTAAAAKALGWRTNIITSGAVTPEQAAQAFNVALSRKPQAIIAIAVDAPLAPQQITAAEKAGIVTVEDAADPEPSESARNDAYDSYRQPLEFTVNAYAAIADSNGTANVVSIDATDIPVLHSAYEQFKSVMAQCAGCKVTPISVTESELGDSTTIQQLVSAALQADPNASYVQLPASELLPPAAAAIRQAGKQEKVKILLEDADSVGLDALTQGTAAFDPGFSLGWLAYAGVDQVVRGMAKAPYLTTAQIALGLHMFTPGNSPKSGNAEDYTGFKIYIPRYDKIWGIDGK
jgi:ribose transport system substrate-binding protein